MRERGKRKRLFEERIGVSGMGRVSVSTSICIECSDILSSLTLPNLWRSWRDAKW